MARPVRCRRICQKPGVNTFSPVSSDGQISMITDTLALDEYEVIRLIDFEKKTQDECAKQMQISRTTVTAIYERARFKIADCIVNGKAFRISGGNYTLCDGSAIECRKCSCHKKFLISDNEIIFDKGDKAMRVAVTYEDGLVFQHFGHTEQFMIYDIVDGVVANTKLVSSNGQGHGALAGFLFELKVDTLICGGIGGGAISALKEAGIKVFGGVQGSADAAVASFIEGKLSFDENVHCDHHDSKHNEEGHSCGEHGCGEHSCGSHC